MLTLPAIGYLAWLAPRHQETFGTVSAWHTADAGRQWAATAVPLLLFAEAANRVPLSGLGILQYLTPTLQLILGVLVFHEPMPAARLAGFVIVWCALAIFTWDAIRHSRQRKAEKAAAVEETATAQPV